MKGATAPIRAVVTQNNCQHTIGKQFNSSALHPPAHRSPRMCPAVAPDTGEADMLTKEQNELLTRVKPDL